MSNRQIIEQSLNQVFPIQCPDRIKTIAFDMPHPEQKEITPEYRFRNDLLRDVIMYLNDPKDSSLYLTGSMGTGKTSIINEVASRINWNVIPITAHNTMELSDLIGKFVLSVAEEGQEPSMLWQDGGLTRAMREGHIFLLNEIDQLDPGVASGLNDLLEGDNLVIADNAGEVVKPHSMFRFVVTGNSSGEGDHTGAYAGVQVMNIATLDRFQFLNVGYMEHDPEIEMLSNHVPHLPLEVITAMVETAKETRKVYESPSGGELTYPISTRSLKRWALMTVAYRDAPDPLLLGLKLAITNRGSAEVAEAIEMIARSVFGDISIK